MLKHEVTCGQELAENAIVPEQFGALFRHVATNLRKHADWVGVSSSAAMREHAAMLEVARAYEAIGDASERAASLMRLLATLDPVAHDPEQMDRRDFVAWMKAKIVLQRKLAGMLLQHVEQSELALTQFAEHASE